MWCSPMTRANMSRSDTQISAVPEVYKAQCQSGVPTSSGPSLCFVFVPLAFLFRKPLVFLHPESGTTSNAFDKLRQRRSRLSHSLSLSKVPSTISGHENVFHIGGCRTQNGHL